MAYAVKRVEETRNYGYRGNFAVAPTVEEGSAEEAALTPHQLTQMLLDGVVTSTANVIAAVEMKNDEEKTANVKKSIVILDHLCETLNMDQGGAVAENLMVVYLYAKQELIRAEEENSTEALIEVVNYLDGISESWRTIA